MDYSVADSHVEEYINKLEKIFCLGSWNITYDLVNDADYMGECHFNWAYKNAHISINYVKHEVPRQLLFTLIHELLHLSFSPIDRTTKTMRQLVSEENREMFCSSYGDAIEECITDIERIIGRAIEEIFELSEETPEKTEVVFLEDSTTRGCIVSCTEQPTFRMRLDDKEMAFYNEKKQSWEFVGCITNVQEVDIISELVALYENESNSS